MCNFLKYITKDITYYQGSSLLADSGELYDTTHQGGRLGTIVFSQALVLFSNLKTSCLQVSAHVLYPSTTTMSLQQPKQ